MRHVRRVVTSSVLVAFSLLLMPATTWAQGSSAASIVGTVKDTSGAVLPGVTVEAASPALIERVRSTVSDDKGEYRIIELRPGTYSVTFTLPGFSTFKRDGLDLGPSFTATVNVELKVGGLEETVTVSGETPLVDTTNVSQQKAMSKTLLDTVPTGKSIYGFVSLMPAAIAPTAQQDVGGGLGDSTMRITIHGAKGDDARLLMDGISYNVMNANGTARGFLVNPLTAQEVVLDAGGGGTAEWGTGGAIVNMINRDGGNNFSGTLFGSGSTDSLQADNLTDSVKAQGLTSAGKSLRIYDLNGVIGGPIKQDKLWFSSSHRRSGHRDLIGGLYRDANEDLRFVGSPAATWKFSPDPTRPVEPTEDNEAHNVRLTWQANATNKFTFAYDWQWNRGQNNIPTLATGTLAWEGSTVGGQYRCTRDMVYQMGWTHPATSKLLLEGGVNYVDHKGGVFPSCIVYPDRVRITDTALNFTYNGAGYGVSQDTQYPTNQRLTVSYVTGAHNFKVGMLAIETPKTYTAGNDRGAIPYTYTFNNGVPSSLTEIVSPLYQTASLRMSMGLFAQDQWKINRLTVNLGIRYEYLNAYAPANQRPAGPLTDAASFPEVDCLPCWHDINPRSAIVYDLFGNGKTALKASFGKYSNAGTTMLAETFRPTTATVNSTTRGWTDTNGNFAPDCDLRNPAVNGECGAMANSSFGQLQVKSSPDPNWITGFGKRGWNKQTSVGVDQQLMSGVAISAGYFRTWYGNATVADNTLVSPSDYDPYCITAPTDPRLGSVSGQQQCGFYDISPAKFGQVNTVTQLASNFGNLTETYTGYDFSMQARLPHGAQLAGGVNIGNSISITAGGAGQVNDVINRCFVVDSPQELLHPLSPVANQSTLATNGCATANPYQARFKINGSYPLPWGLQAAAVFQSLPGAPYQGLLTVTTATIQPSLGRPLAGGTRSVQIDLLPTFGSFLDARVNQLDLRLSKIVKLGNRLRIQGNFDLYNVSNSSTVLGVITAYGPTWLNPTQIMPARLAKLGVQLDF